MKISRNTRWAKEGQRMAESLIGTIHGFYLNGNALEYLQSLIEPLNVEFKRRIEYEINRKRKETKKK